MSLFFLRSVHCSIVPRYCMAENFRGRKLSWFSRFCRYTRSFLHKRWGVVSFATAKASTLRKFYPQSYFHQFCESFLPRKFPAICYVLKLIDRACRWCLEIYHSCSNLWDGKIHLTLIRMNNSLQTVLALIKSRWTALLLIRPWKT